MLPALEEVLQAKEDLFSEFLPAAGMRMARHYLQGLEELLTDKTHLALFHWLQRQEVDVLGKRRPQATEGRRCCRRRRGREEQQGGAGVDALHLQSAPSGDGLEPRKKNYVFDRQKAPLKRNTSN